MHSLPYTLSNARCKRRINVLQQTHPGGVPAEMSRTELFALGISRYPLLKYIRATVRPSYLADMLVHIRESPSGSEDILRLHSDLLERGQPRSTN